MMIQSETLAISDQPRERLEKEGAKALTHQELLALIIQSGNKTKSCLAISEELLDYFHDLYGIKEASLSELQQIDGIGKIKAIQLQAVLELGERMARCKQHKYGKVLSSSQIGEQLVQEMKHLHQEHVVVIYLNAKNDIIRKETVFIGSLNQSVAHPREIFRHAVRYSASRLILVHNHPSGNPEPSLQDELFTKRVVESGELIGIDVLDHFVIGEETYVSFQETGRM